MITPSSQPHSLTPCDVTLGGPPLRIAADGTWWRGSERYDMANPKHERIVKLLASVLKRDETGAYWLITPVEKCGVAVEDTPFVAVEADLRGHGRAQEIDIHTNLGDTVALGPDHPLVLPDQSYAEETPVPRLLVRDGLAARLSRAVFYDLIRRGSEGEAEIGGKRCPVVGVWSRGCFYPLGAL